MKKIIQHSFLGLLFLGLVIVSCKKNLADVPGWTQLPHTEELKPVYSSIDEFRQGIAKTVNLIQYYHILAYLDTLPNGFPNVQGRKVPLTQFGSLILEKLQGDQEQIKSAVYDVFHFDGATFSLISYIMKAQMVSDISAQTLASVVSEIPLPPIAVAEFQPPVKIANVAVAGDCCKDNDCNPQVKILVTWAYKTGCGNRVKKTSGYAANNTLTHMDGNTLFKFDAEVSGCPCPGSWTSKVTAPAGASYGEGGSGKSVTVFPVSSGTYTITFTYKVCDKEVTKTFTLSIG